MSAIQTSASPEHEQAGVVLIDAWYLLSEGRRFGPLSEDELRGYFRAGMVKAGDAIAIPGQVGTLRVAEVAALLQVAPPSSATAPSNPIQQPALSPAVALPAEEGHLGLLLTVGAVVVMGALAYFGFSGRLTPSRASNESMAVVSPKPVVENVEAPSQVLPTAFENSSAASTPAFAAPPPVDSAPPAAQTVATPVAVGNVAAVTNAVPQRAIDTWHVAASRLVNEANWSGLLAHCQKWTVAEPTRDLAWWYLGIAHTQSNNYAAAIDALKYGLSLSPSHFKMRWALADAYMYSRHYRQSADIYSVLVQEQPNDARLWNDLGIAMANLGEYDESVAAFEKSVAINPGYRKAWANLAQSYAHFGYKDRADAAIAKANGR